MNRKPDCRRSGRWSIPLFCLLLGTFPGGSKSLLNCDLARSLCAQHEACASVLRVIPRLCGVEKGTCSTVTVEKCKAGLRMLQGFPYFLPTCLCREPDLDPKCNEYRTFIFDHPCMYVQKQEYEDLYQVSGLPYCDHALDHCQKDERCSHLIYRFRQACRKRDDHCVMESRDACQEAWSAIRLTPVFGCICPTNTSKKSNKCERTLQQIHNNPCVAWMSSRIESFVGQHADFALGSRPPSAADFSPKSPAESMPSTSSATTSMSSSKIREDHLLNWSSRSLLSYDDDDDDDDDLGVKRSVRSAHIGWLSTPSTSSSSSSSIRPGLAVVPRQNPAPGTWAVAADVRLPRFISVNPCWDLSAALRVHGHGLWPVGYRSAITGLVAPQDENGADPGLSSPLSSSNNHGSTSEKSWPLAGPDDQQQEHDHQHQSVTTDEETVGGGGVDGGGVLVDAAGMRSTCHEAERSCRNDRACMEAFRDVESTCDPHHCSPNPCRRSIKTFYARLTREMAEDIAYCVCSETDEDCMDAMNRLRPPCSLKSPRGMAPLCHQVAHECKTNVHCRPVLESFEQACAVDSDTLRCAGRRQECRTAKIRTLGTSLSVPCNCPSTSSPVADVYNCLGWQRLLWLNPCVDEALDDYLRKKFGVAAVPSNKGVQHVENPYTGQQQPSQPTAPSDGVDSGLEPSPRQGPSHSRSDSDSDSDRDYVRPAPPSSFGKPGPGNDDDEPTIIVTTSTKKTTTFPPYTTTTTTSTTTEKTTTIPPRFCALVKGAETYRIMEGSTVRIYDPAKPECSELCECPMAPSSYQYTGYNRSPLGAPKCRALDCVDRQGCYTLSAPYEHGAPAYQAYRGKCICYSGAFICTKPDKREMYELGEAKGVFLFLGFSRADERILSPLTKKLVNDTIPLLERIIVPDAPNKTACRLILYNSTEENLILQARSLDFTDELLVNGTVPSAILWRERNECTPALESLKELINRPDPRIRNTPALSMLKLADVEVRIPAMSNGGATPGLVAGALLATIAAAAVAVHAPPGAT